MKELENRFINVKYGSKIAEAVIEKLESLGLSHGCDYVPKDMENGIETCLTTYFFNGYYGQPELTLDELFSIEKKPKFEKSKVLNDLDIIKGEIDNIINYIELNN